MTCDVTQRISILTLFSALTVTPYTVKGLKLLMVRVVSWAPTWYKSKNGLESGIFSCVGKLLLNSGVKVLKCYCYSINCVNLR